LTLVLLDTNSYLRFAKRIRPIIGVKFGQRNYVLAIHKVVEDEVHRSPRLQDKFPWFDVQEFAEERLAKQIRLKEVEKARISIAHSVLLGWVSSNVESYTTAGRSPPGWTDCWLLALGQERNAVIVTDDLGIHLLAEEFRIEVWHGYELLDKLRTAKTVDSEKVREIYDALETNGDLPKSWSAVKHTRFMRIFGKKKS
jgi:hypothetical protein